MDPITVAVAMAAVAQLTDVEAPAVDDAFAHLKEAVASSYPLANQSLGALESRPLSQLRQRSLAAVLAETGADRDPKLVSMARALLDAIKKEVPQAPAIAIVDMADTRKAEDDAEQHATHGISRAPAAHQSATRRATKSQPAPREARSSAAATHGFWDFWTTVPGLLTGIGGLITAIIAAIGLLAHTGAVSMLPGASSPGNLPANVPGPILRQGQITLKPGDFMNLENGHTGGVLDADLAYSDPHYLFKSGGSFMAPVTGQVTPDKCVVALSSRHDDTEDPSS